ncbi:MAG: hypothetical protein IT356_01850 [Gemmatimonadaceae bacterium]|nr:hypothetical protein [Gemmatimonadaceae bacterium]
MPSWNEVLSEFEATPDPAKPNWLQARQTAALKEIGRLRGDRHVLLYGAAFLQKPQAPPQNVQITSEDLNGLMSVIYGMTWAKGLTLVLHTPGGVTNAAETIVAYLRSKFQYIEVIVPTYAMSAGTMISLASDRIVMGRQSQLGPIDPQFIVGSGALSARAIVDQFERAKKEILANTTAAHVWAPILQSVGPALLQEARNALDYGERMVAGWLGQYMFREERRRNALARKTARHFNDASKHKSHGRRIDRDEARSVKVAVDDLEASQELQEQVLSAYHLMTLLFEKGPATKVLASDTGRVYVKNWQHPQLQFPVQFATPPAGG